MRIPVHTALLLAAVAALAQPRHAVGAEERQLVKLPPPMEAHMLANMRDHLRSIEEILAALASGKPAQAAEIAERRIGMSSLVLHGADHLGAYMPEPMRRMGLDLHHAAGQLRIAVENADLEPGPAGAKMVYKALEDVVTTCNACHAAYRLR